MSTRRPRHRITCLGSGTLFALSLAVLVGGGCADRSRPDFRGGGSPRDEPIVVEVRNRNFADVTVHAGRDGGWHRLGDVTGHSTATLEVPPSLGGPAAVLSFRVHAIGSPAYTDYETGRLSVSPGDVVVVTVAPVLGMSSWSIRE